MLPTRTSLKLVSLVATSMPVLSNGAGGRDSLSLERVEAGEKPKSFKRARKFLIESRIGTGLYQKLGDTSLIH